MRLRVLNPGLRAGERLPFLPSPAPPPKRFTDRPPQEQGCSDMAVMWHLTMGLDLEQLVVTELGALMTIIPIGVLFFLGSTGIEEPFAGGVGVGWSAKLLMSDQERAPGPYEAASPGTSQCPEPLCRMELEEGLGGLALYG